MQYFKHFGNMRHDVKIRRLISRYGIEGYGVYCIAIESITESLSEQSPIPDLQETCEDMAEFYNGNTSRIEEIMKYIVTQGLLDIEEGGVIVCHKVYKFLDTSQTRSDKLRNMIKLYKEKTKDGSLDIDHVYIMKNKSNSLYKIGKSLYPEQRRKELSSKEGSELEIIALKENEGYMLENKIHRDLKDKNVVNEWFSLNDLELDTLIKNYGFRCVRNVSDKSERKEEEKKKNRKEKNKYNPSDDLVFFNDSDFQEVWKDFKSVRTKKKAVNSDRAIKKLITSLLEFSGGDKDKAIEIVEKSADSGWSSLYPLKTEPKKPETEREKTIRLLKAEAERRGEVYIPQKK
jgi:hypothetical protein